VAACLVYCVSRILFRMSMAMDSEQYTTHIISSYIKWISVAVCRKIKRVERETDQIL